MQTNPLTNRPYSGSYDPGHDSGAITIEWRSSRVLTATVRSFTRPAGPRHTIQVNRITGHVRCSCNAYKFRHPDDHALLTDPATGWCKHIAAWHEQLATAVIDRNAEVDASIPNDRPYTDVTEQFLGGADWSPTPPVPAHEATQADHLRAQHAQGRVAVIRGSVYIIGPEDAPASERGKGGQRFDIRFHDGRTVTTHNLWETWVPAHAQSEFPENARFLSKREVVA